MKKTLIAAAAMMAMAGAAQAQVSIYGLIDLSYGKSLLSDLQDRDADFHSGGDNDSSEGNSTSRVGLKGSMDVGSSLKANFRLETSGIQSNGDLNGAFFGRQMWAGLSGGFGEVRLGRQDSIPFQMMVDFDFNGASNGVSSGAYSGVGAFNRGRQNKSLQYLSPDMGGLTFQVGFVPEGNGFDLESDFDHDQSYFSGGIKYAAGPLAVAAVYEGERYEDDRSRFWSVAGSYDFGVAKVMASWADGGKNFIDGGEGTGKGFGVGVVAPVAGFNVGAIYHRNNTGFAFYDKVTSWEVFVNKEVLKNTYLYAEYGKWKASIDDSFEGGGSESASGWAVGMIFTF